ncbi:unnamed protein product [Amoebophrya sp. A25]|nr:unnamed protein product [Amoebophrya sp. A25]|eukprot:GSA25T00022738001.1
MYAYGVLAEGTGSGPLGPILYNRNAVDPKTGKPDPRALLRGSRDEDMATGSIVQLWRRQCQAAPDRNAVGFRKLLKVHMEADPKDTSESPKKFEKLELANEVTFWNAREHFMRVRAIACALKEEKMFSAHDNKVVIYAETQADWLCSALAAMSQNVPIVTVYASLGADGAGFALQQTQANVALVDLKLAKILKKILMEQDKSGDQVSFLQNVIFIGSRAQADADTLAFFEGREKQQPASSTFRVHFLDSLVAKYNHDDGSNTFLQDSSWIVSTTKASDPAVIMYTSGTTSAPKGVVLSHGNLAALLNSTEPILKTAPNVPSDGTYLAYLPLAHVMELATETTALVNGLSVVYGSPHTINDSGVKLKVPESKGDLSVVRPHIMLFVPAVLDKLYAGLNTIFEQRGGMAKYLYLGALKSGKRRLHRSYATKAGDGLVDPLVGANCFYESLLMKKIRARLGGRLCATVAASAPVSKEQLEFFQTILGCPMRQAYGLTETCGASCVVDWRDNTPGMVGPPTKKTVVRLLDWEEGNYRNSDVRDPKIAVPRGEILIGGPQVCQGYFVPGRSLDSESLRQEERKAVSSSKNDDKKNVGANEAAPSTAASSTVGSPTKVDDEDEEKVAEELAEKVVAELATSLSLTEADLEMVGKNRAEFFDKDGFRWFHTGDIGCVTPSGCVKIIDRKKDLWKGPQGEYVALTKVESACKLSPLIEMCMCYGLQGGQYPVLMVVPNKKNLMAQQATTISLEQQEATILASIVAECKKAGLVAFEIPKKVGICEGAWTPENGLLTAAMKIKRPVIAQEYKSLIDRLYAEA